MFTDIKNCSKDITINSKDLTIKPKKRTVIKRIFRSIVRILRHKQNRNHHPNNINLNNEEKIETVDKNQKNIINLSIESADDEYAEIIKKAANDEEFIRSYYETDPFTDSFAADENCNSSSYGGNTYTQTDDFNLRTNQNYHKKKYSHKQMITSKNLDFHQRLCEHEKLLSYDWDNYCHIKYDVPMLQEFNFTRIEESVVDDIIIPVNYIRTDVGTFFWTAAQNRYDDDLMNSIYDYPTKQQGQPQFVN